MKKLFSAFVTACLLAACLCIPAFAADDCPHLEYSGGVCAACGEVCPYCLGYGCCDYCDYGHNYEYSGGNEHYCSGCGSIGECGFVDGVCIVCSNPCSHNRVITVVGGRHFCGACSLWLACSYENGACPDCGFDPSFITCICDQFAPGLVSYSLVSEDSETEILNYLLRADCLICGGCASYVHQSTSMFSDLGYPLDYLAVPASFTWNGVECLCGDEFLAVYENFTGDSSVTFRFVNGCLFVFVDGCSKPIPADFFFEKALCSDAVPLKAAGVTDDKLSYLSETLGCSVTEDSPVLLEFVADTVAWSNGQITFDPGTPSEVLPAVSSLVTSAIGWISAFVLCIMSNTLLLIFIVSVFAILGLYLLKRSIHL